MSNIPDDLAQKTVLSGAVEEALVESPTIHNRFYTPSFKSDDFAAKIIELSEQNKPHIEHISHILGVLKREIFKTAQIAEPKLVNTFPQAFKDAHCNSMQGADENGEGLVTIYTIPEFDYFYQLANMIEDTTRQLDEFAKEGQDV